MRHWRRLAANEQATTAVAVQNLEARIVAVRQAECELQLRGDIWPVRYFDEYGTYHAPHNQCVAWLAKLLAAPNRLLTVAELRGDSAGKLAWDAKIGNQRLADGQTISQARKRLEDIDATIAETGGNEELEDEKVKLLRHIEELTRRPGKPLDTPLRRDHSNIATQLRKFRSKLEPDMPHLAAHLKASLKMELPHFGYYPAAPAPNWKI